MHVLKRRRTLFQHMRGTPKPKCGFMRKVQRCGKCKVPKTGALILVHLTALSGSQNTDLVQQLRTISKPAFSIGLMEIKTFLQNSEGLGDLTS